MISTRLPARIKWGLQAWLHPQPPTGGRMFINVIHSILNTLNSSEAHISYASWFASPSFPAMLLFFAAALMATIHLIPLGEKV